MPSDLVKKIDEQSKRQANNRSEFIRQAVRKQLSTLEHWQELTESARSDYKGPDMSYEEVADMIHDERTKQTQRKLK